MFFAVAVLAVLPVALTLGWIVFCSRPVQCRVWMPSLFWLVCKSSLVHKVRVGYAPAPVVAIVIDCGCGRSHRSRLTLYERVPRFWPQGSCEGMLQASVW